jgi:plasmid replication initiation protein
VKARKAALVGNNTNHIADARSPLLPDRREQNDFFVCDIFDAAPKADMAAMEHPIFSVSTKPDYRERRYENGQHWVAVKPSGEGLATVHDRDILIYCISQIMAALNEGREVSQIVRFKAYDLLQATNRGTDGRGYQQLRAALARLRGTTIETNITTNDLEILEGFGLIDSYKIVRETREGRMLDLELKLSDWVFNAIRANEVLTIHRDYFRLRKPLERRIYEIARKHCGQQSSWKIGIAKLQNKCGSSSTLKEFRRLIRNIVEQDEMHNHLPDYAIRLDEAGDMVGFTKRKDGSLGKGAQAPLPLDGLNTVRSLKPDTFLEAKECAPGWDVYYLEQEWRAWITEPPRNPDKAFLGFCRKWSKTRGRP